MNTDLIIELFLEVKLYTFDVTCMITVRWKINQLFTLLKVDCINIHVLVDLSVVFSNLSPFVVINSRDALRKCLKL